MTVSGWRPTKSSTDTRRSAHDVSGLTADELERARRELEAGLALARPGSMTSAPIMAQIRAIDAALAQAPRSPWALGTVRYHGLRKAPGGR
jgi:hypothetical protein